MPETLRFLMLSYRVDAFGSASADTLPQSASSGLLGESLGSVRQLSTNPEQNVLEATLAGKGAESLARELEELAASTTLDAIPVVDSRPGSRRDGYYSTTLVAAGPLERASKEAYTVEFTLEKRGTRQTHWRQADADVAQLDHGFGSTAEAHLGIPANATKVRWCDTVGNDVQALTSPDVIATRSGEFRDVEIVDVQDAPVSNPSAIYELDYSEEGWADPGVWDTEGNDAKTDSDGNVVWSHVYATQHEWDGLPVLDNGLLRVEFDEASGELTAWEWDDSSEAWTETQLSRGDWSLFDVDVVEIGQAQIVVYCEFVHTDGSMFALEGRLETGATDLLWSIPDDETGPIPGETTSDGLWGWLEPIASERLLTANPQRSVVARSEVSKR